MSEAEVHSSRFAKRQIVIPIAVALLVAAGLLWYFSTRKVSTNELVLYGNIDVREVDVAFNEGDRIIAMHVEEGDSVTKGELLAELDSSRLEHTVLVAKAEVASQTAVLARFEHGSRPEEISRARAEVAAAEADLHDARVSHQRQDELVKAKVASQQLADDARAAHLMAEARLKAAKENLRLAIEGPRSEDTEAARAQLSADQNALELAQHRLDDTKLYAPADGTVLTRILEPGAVVLPNTPVYTLALSDRLWVRTYLSEADLGRVAPGMEAEIASDSFPDRRYSGWVGFISPTAEFTPKPVETPDLRTSLVYRARVYVRNPDNTLRQGMPVTVHLKLGSTAKKQPQKSADPHPAATPVATPESPK